MNLKASFVASVQTQEWKGDTAQPGKVQPGCEAKLQSEGGEGSSVQMVHLLDLFFKKSHSVRAL